MAPTTTSLTSDRQAEARAKIDEEIGRLTRQIQSLRSARNELAWVSRLPTELMRAIFLLTRNSASSEMSLVLSWVSRQWRDLSLGIPQLWSSIDFINSERFYASLTRSKNVALEVNLEVDHDIDDYSNIAFIFDALPQIKTLEIDADDELDRRIQVYEDWSKDAPNLTTLSLRGFSLPDRLFSGRYPSLDSINLSHCRFRLDIFPASDALSELTIHEPDIPISVSEVLDILSSARNLGELDLCHAMDMDELETAPSRAVIDLPKLYKLSVGSHLPEVTSYFFQHITFPQDIGLEVNIDSATFGNNLTVLSEIIDRGQFLRRQFKSFRFCVSPRFCSFLLDDQTDKLEGHQMVNISFDVASSNPPSFLLLLDTLRPALSHLQYIVLNGDDDTDGLEFFSAITTFGRFESLHSLRITVDFLRPFIRDIKTITPPPDGADFVETHSTFIAFPALEELIFDGVEVSRDDLVVVHGWLESRMEKSEPESRRKLGKLVFFGCPIKKEDIEACKLRDVVDEVMFRFGR